MASFDKTWTIERYPDFRDSDNKRIRTSYSYGCAELDLKELLEDMRMKILEL